MIIVRTIVICVFESFLMLEEPGPSPGHNLMNCLQAFLFDGRPQDIGEIVKVSIGNLFVLGRAMGIADLWHQLVGRRPASMAAAFAVSFPAMTRFASSGRSRFKQASV